MADEPTTTNTSRTTETPSSSGAPSGNPSPAEPWRAGAHSQFAGRSAEEILGALEMATSQLARFNQAPALPPPAPRNAFDFDLPDDEYLNGAQVKQILRRIAEAPTPVDWVGRQQSAQAVLGAVQMQRADDFKRWPQEINVELQKLPQEHWTLDNLKTIVDIVKSRHIDELAAEKAERLVNEAHPTIRSGTGGSGGGPTTQPTLDAEGLPKGWVEQLRAQGIDEAKVREFCQETGQTVEAYYADVMKWGKSGVIHG